MVLLLFLQRFIQSNLQTVVVEEVLDHQVIDLVKEISNPVVEMINLEDSNLLAILKKMKTAFHVILKKKKTAHLLLPVILKKMKTAFLVIQKKKTAHLPHVIQKKKIVNH